MFPQSRLGNFVFVADVVTVIAPEHDDCVVTMWTLFQGLQNISYTRICKGTGSEISLNSFLPLSMPFDDAEFFSGHRPTTGRDIVKIVIEKHRQPHLIERMHVEVLLWCVPLQMRAVNSTGEKERLVVILRQEFCSTLSCLPVCCFFSRLLDRRPVHQAGEDFI